MQKSTPVKDIKSVIFPFIGTIAILSAFWFSYKVIFDRKKADKPTPLAQTTTNKTNPSATPASLNSIPPSQEIDSDNDGLSDPLETIYKTDPNNPDTDEDGYKDGAEVANGYDPLIKSPNDKIDRLASRLGSNILNPETSPLPSPSLTELFVNKTGITPTQNNLATNDEQVNQFINETNARGILPIILDSDIHIVNTTGKTAIVKYLDTLSTGKNPKLKTVTPEQITTAFKTLTATNNSAPINKIISDLQNNTSIFRDVDVPLEAIPVHKKYLAAVVALQDNTQALRNYQTDYASVLVAASRIEGLRAVFTEVGNDIQALEKKYNIK